MQKLTALLCGLLLTTFATAQVVTIDYLMGETPTRISKLNPSKLTERDYLVKMDFGSAAIQNPEIFKKLRGKRIERVDIVYTDFRESNTFSQPQLNRKRFAALQKLRPDLFENSLIEWGFVEQTAARSPEQGKKYFHGFVIRTAAKRKGGNSSSSPEAEINWIVDALSHYDSRGNPIEDEGPDTLGYDTTFDATRTVVDGVFLPKRKGKRERGIVYARPGIWKRSPKILTSFDTLIFPLLSAAAERARFMWQPDTVIFKALDEDHDWGKVLVAEDVTGSMSPYVAQTLLWRRRQLANSNVESFVFFNDGDNVPSNDIGNIGGVYPIRTTDVDELEEQVYTAMRNGSGGDAPENNLEGIIKGLNAYPECDAVVMIADNFAPVKDIELLDQIDRPVHVILCGTQNQSIQAHYLSIAYKTGGSVHTMDSALNDIADLKEGDTMKAGGKKYKLTDGEFVLTR